MMVFIVPLKSVKTDESTSRLELLFERTIRSICAQTNQNFKVIVVCNTIPNINFSHDNICYVKVDFTLGPSVMEWFDLTKENDKARRILTAIDYAKKFQPTHFMVVDADDCVNNIIAQYVNENMQELGWYSPTGYVYPEGGSVIFRKREQFNSLCGTCLIIKADRLADTIVKKKDFLFYRHSSTSVNGEELLKLPFPASVYSVRNGENYHMSKSMTNQLSTGRRYLRLKWIFKRLINYRVSFLTKGLRNKFGLYELNAQVKAIEKNTKTASEL